MTLYLFVAWGVLYLLGAIFPFIPEPEWLGVLTSLVFFVPPAVLLYRDRTTARLIRILSITWLAVTVFLLVLNILSVTMTELAGTVLYYIMAIFSSPMICGRNWLVSMFCFACLLIVSQKLLKKTK